MKELHGDLSSQAFIDYRTGTSLLSGKPWSWDEFFVALAWQGLVDTKQYQEDVVDKGLKEDYDFYDSESNSESSTNKCG